MCPMAVRSFVDGVKAEQPARPKTVSGKLMPQFLVTIYYPTLEDEVMSRDIDALND